MEWTIDDRRHTYKVEELSFSIFIWEDADFLFL